MKFRKISIGALSASFLLIPSPLSATPVAKPGSKCPKAGITQIVGGKQYKCIKKGSKLTWNNGAYVPARPTASTSANAEPSASPVEATPTASSTSGSAPALVKFKNCTEAKAAGAAPLTKAKTPELYELNAGLDRDKDGVACES